MVVVLDKPVRKGTCRSNLTDHARLTGSCLLGKTDCRPGFNKANEQEEGRGKENPQWCTEAVYTKTEEREKRKTDE